VSAAEKNIERARAASGDELAALLHSHTADVLLALLENPRLNEDHLCQLLERKDLPGLVIEEVARKREWMEIYRLRLRMARHPRTPRTLGIRLVRQLQLFDLVNVAITPSTPMEIRRLAEEQIISRLAQIPLGQKITLARRGSARVAGALVADGVQQVVPVALDNGYLTEAQVVKALGGDDVPEHVVLAVAAHRKWSRNYNVRMALVRHPLTPLSRVLAFLPDLTVRDLDELTAAKKLTPQLRSYLRAEVASRSRRGRVKRSR